MSCSIHLLAKCLGIYPFVFVSAFFLGYLLIRIKKSDIQPYNFNLLSNFMWKRPLMIYDFFCSQVLIVVAFNSWSLIVLETMIRNPVY